MKKSRSLKSLRKIKNSHLCNTNLEAYVRLKNTQVHKMSPEEIDLMVVDLTLKELYNEGDRIVVDFKKDVLEKYNIQFNEKTLERYWDILDATNLVNPVVGFGNTNKLSLGIDGYNLMHRFGSYKNYVHTMMQANMPAGAQRQAAQQQASKPSNPPNSNPGELEEPYYEEGN